MVNFDELKRRTGIKEINAKIDKVFPYTVMGIKNLDSHVEKITMGSPIFEYTVDTLRGISLDKSDCLEKLHDSSFIEIDNQEENYDYMTASEQELIEKKGAHQKALSHIAAKIVECLHFKNCGESVCFFDGRIWVILKSSEQLRKASKDCVSNFYNLSSSQWKELYNIIISWGADYQELNEDAVAYQHLVCFRNGVYDVVNKKLLNHSPIYPFTSYINCDLPCSDDWQYSNVFDDYLDSAFKDFPEVKKRSLQWMAYISSSLPNQKKIALAIGSPNSGKSTYANICKMIVGNENTASFNMSNVNRFSNDFFYKKKLALCQDMSDKRVSKESCQWIKEQTGGDWVEAQIKHNRNTYSYVSKCKFMIASNYRPKFGDAALNERLLTIPMPFSLTQEEINPNLLQELREELPFILCELMDELGDYIAGGMQFVDIGELEYYVPVYGNELNDSVRSFFSECCQLDANNKISCPELFEAYQRYCLVKKKQIETERAFFNAFKKIARENNVKDDRNVFRGYRISILDIDRDLDL